MKQILIAEPFETFNYSSIFDNTLFCLGEKQGMLINDECSLWYNGVLNFLMSVWDRRKEILYGNGLVVKVNQNNPTPECEVYGTECYDSCFLTLNYNLSGGTLNGKPLPSCSLGRLSLKSC